MTPRRQKGQSIVEFALVLPLLALFIMVTIQFGLLFVMYYSETRMARETARWLAVNPDATDAQVEAHITSTLLPGMIRGQLNAEYTPCGSAAPPCTHPNRAQGNTLFVRMTYTPTNLLFLPTEFRMGRDLVVKIPTTLPDYKVSVMVE